MNDLALPEPGRHGVRGRCLEVGEAEIVGEAEPEHAQTAGTEHFPAGPAIAQLSG